MCKLPVVTRSGRPQNRAMTVSDLAGAPGEDAGGTASAEPTEAAGHVSSAAEPPVDAPRYTVAAVARRLGVAPSTLRTWARRYGLGPTDHAAGAHRRYSVADLARLDVMRRHVLDGVPPAHAARIAAAAETTGSEPVSSGAEFEDARRGGADTCPGGRVLPLPGGSPAERGLARAAMALDATAAGRIIREHIASAGVIATWDGLLCPVLGAAGHRWQMTADGVDVEHLLSEAVIAALRDVVVAATFAPEHRSLLLTSAEDEYHSLPLYAVAAALAERRTACRMLGAALPADALRAAVRRLGPAGLFVWSQVPDTAHIEALATLPQTRPPTTVVVGGPGWGAAQLPDRVIRAGDLTAAVTLLAAAAGR